jgi:hypothetical protein
MVLSFLQMLLSILKYKNEKLRLAKLPAQAADCVENSPKKSMRYLLCNKYGHVLTWVVILICALAMSQIGFILSAIIIMFVTTYIMCPRGQQNIPAFIALSIGVPVATYFVFVKFFFLMLPVGNMWKNLGFF